MFLPETIDLGHSDKYILSVRLKSSGFMFSISDPANGKNYCLRETTFAIDHSLIDNLKRIVFELPFLTQQFKQVNAVVVSKDYELLPDKYYHHKKKKEFYNFTHHHKAEHVLTSDNPKHKNSTLFKIEKDVFDFLSRSLSTPAFVHHTNLLVKQFEGKTKPDTSGMFINFHDNMMDVLCFQEQMLAHCISYEDEIPANQLYYILKMWEQCEYSQLNDMLFISGTPPPELVVKLQRYVNNIENIDKPGETYFWHEDARKAPLDLLALAL